MISGFVGRDLFGDFVVGRAEELVEALPDASGVAGLVPQL